MFALAQDFEACVGCGFIRWWCHLGGGFYRGQRCGSGELVCFYWVGRGFAGGEAMSEGVKSLNDTDVYSVQELHARLQQQ